MDIKLIKSLFLQAYEKQDSIELSQLLTTYAARPLQQIKNNLRSMGQFFDKDTKIKDVADLIIDDSRLVNSIPNNSHYQLPFETELDLGHQLVITHYEQSSNHSDNLQNNLIDVIELRKIVFEFQDAIEINKLTNYQAVATFNLKFLNQLNGLEKLIQDSLTKINFILNNDILLANKINEIKNSLPKNDHDKPTA